MRAVVQRVRWARVSVDGAVIGEIEKGLLALLGFGHDDREPGHLIDKLCTLRIFADEAGKMNRSLLDIGGGLLLVSQFTLYGDCSKGRRPSFTGALAPAEAETLYDACVAQAKKLAPHVATGKFGADMQVELCNDGPVTLIIE